MAEADENTISGWSRYPDVKPTQSGYYYTYYFNTDRKGPFYKAHYYRADLDEWVWTMGRVPIVLGFIEESYHSHYGPCASWGYEEERTDRIGLFDQVDAPSA